MKSISNIFLKTFNNANSLIYGIGNIGRQDDGLGWQMIDWIEGNNILPNAEKMKHYQLHLEDADLISYKKNVLFIDASKEKGLKTFEIEKIKPNIDFSFTSHDISIAPILATCKMCFNYMPNVYLLKIKGYEWELKEGITQKAKQNLDKVKNSFMQNNQNNEIHRK